VDTHYTGFLLGVGGGEWAEFKILCLLLFSLSGLRGDGGTQRLVNVSEIAVLVTARYEDQ